MKGYLVSETPAMCVFFKTQDQATPITDIDWSVLLMTIIIHDPPQQKQLTLR